MNYLNLYSLGGSVAITFGGLLLVVPPAYAAAGPGDEMTVVAPSDVVRRDISYSGLDLTSVDGQRNLNGAVRRGINSLCTEANEDLETSVAHRFSMINCGHRAWGQARPQIARAIQRSQELAANGSSAIAPVAISISVAMAR